MNRKTKMKRKQRYQLAEAQNLIHLTYRRDVQSVDFLIRNSWLRMGAWAEPVTFQILETLKMYKKKIRRVYML